MHGSLQSGVDGEALRRTLTVCLTVGQTQPVVELEEREDHACSVTVDFPVPCEPQSQTAIRLSLAEALAVCDQGSRQPGRGGGDRRRVSAEQ